MQNAEKWNTYLYRLSASTVLLLFFMTAALAHAEERDLQWYRNHGVTIAGLEKASPLSFIGYDGNPKGFIVDYWNLWSRKTGIPVRFRLTDWPTTLAFVKDGECDLHSGLFYNEERDEFLDFSQPYQRMKAALMVLKENDADVDEIFSTYKIAVLHKGFSEHFMTTHHPESNIKSYDSNSAIAKALVNKTVQAIVGDHPVVGYEASKLGVSQNLIVKEILYEKELRSAVREGNSTLLKIVNQGLSAISESERNTIHHRWFVTETTSTDWIRNLVIVIGVLVVSLVALLLMDRRKTGLSSADD